GREAPTRTTTDQRDPGGLSPPTAPEGRTPVRNNPADRNTPRFEPQPGGNNPGGGVKPGGNSTSPDRKNPRMDKVDQTVPGGNLQPGLVPAGDDGLKPYPGTRTGPERKEAIPSAKSPAPSGSKLKSPDKSDSRGLRKIGRASCRERR